jgi:hypothetical protein
LRAVLYLLSELEHWQADGTISPAQAAALRSVYERRRDDLRAQITASAERDITAGQERVAGPKVSQAEVTGPARNPVTDQPAAAAAPPSIQSPVSRPPSPSPPNSLPRPEARRALVETLAEPYTLRLLLYTGAAMFVVGIIIWLRDVLYLKLQEPIVQAALVMTGTMALIASGWLTILRTRQRLTGRALTLAGSLLVPVNFWFLVRSGLIADHGRAWLVCTFCALLYALTAALLGERLYVYLACAASVATGWALVYRAEASAPGLYALVTMGASLLFIHLSRMFPASVDASEARQSPLEDKAASVKRARTATGPRWSRELWSAPLVHAALSGATLCAILYMPLRIGPSLSLYDGILGLRAHVYDPGTAILLFGGVAYIAWFAGRYIYTGRRARLYALCALALLWAQFLTMDGLRLSARAQLLALGAAVLAVSLFARRAQSIELARALYMASVFSGVMLLPVAFAVLFGAGSFTFSESAGLGLLAAGFAVLSTPRFSGRAAQNVFAYLAAMLASTAFLVALASASLSSVTLLTAACALWPFALYAVAELSRRARRETQLAAPFERMAGAEFVLLLLWASLIVLILYLSKGNAVAVPRAATFCALFAPLLYGILSAARERFAFGAGLASIAAIVAVASSLDALQERSVWPHAWPIAAGVVCAAFVLHQAGARLIRVRRGQEEDESRAPLEAMIRLVMDGAVVLCALLWFSTALFDRGSFGSVCVLLLASLYWSERAAWKRAGWTVYVSAAHACAFFLSLLIALRVDEQWFAALLALVPVPVFFAAAGYARRRGAGWLAGPLGQAAVAVMGLAFVAALLQATPHLRAGDALLLAPSVTMGTLACVSFVASIWTQEGRARVRYFRAGLCLSVIAYALVALRAGFEPLVDVEVYTSPVAILLLAVAYVSFRRAWNDYARDTSLLFWTGSILLGGPLLLRALQFRLVLEEPAPGRDLATLCAALALLLFGTLGRLRAPVIFGAVTLLVELAALALTSVDWLQVPLKLYLVTVGALLALVGWMFEYRREQLVLIRNRLNARRETARARFGEWR